MIEEDLTAHLLADDAVAALVDDRVAPGFLPPGEAWPAITYFQVSDDRVHTMDGADPDDRRRYQINCWGATYAQAKSLAAAVKARLDGFRGTMNGNAYQGVFLLDEGDLQSGPQAIDSDAPYGVRQDYRVCV